jgi:hypothetical protein
MQNVPLASSNQTYQRTFKIDKHIMSLFSHNRVVQASFFDLFDNVIDFALHYKNFLIHTHINSLLTC